jgi:hypothetical protein
MTNKTQIAMFSIAALAVLSFGMFPTQNAFAGWETASFGDYAGAVGTTEIDDSVDTVCGESVTSRMQVRNADPSDQVQLYYDIRDCSSWDKVVFSVNVNGGSVEYLYTEYNNAHGYQNYNGPISNGDYVTGTIVYWW